MHPGWHPRRRGWHNHALYVQRPALYPPRHGTPSTVSARIHPTGCGGTHPIISEGESTHVAVKIRLKRMGKIHAPYYRIVVADSRKKRDGAVIEEIGKYHPTENPSLIEVVSERALYWLGVGAQPTEQVAALLKVTGDWQKFKGEDGAEGSLKTSEAKQSAEERIAAADKAAAESREGAKKAKAAEGEEAGELEAGFEEAPAEGESTEDAEAATTDEA